MMEFERTQINAERAKVMAAATEAADYIRSTTGHGIELLRSLKFEQRGRHPLEPRPLNVIEQVNQTFTCLVTLKAVELLFEWHPQLTKIKLNVGTKAGSDIESLDTTFAAEVFAAVDPKNNRKLKRDVEKVAKRVDAQHRYVFFHSPLIPEGLVQGAGETVGVQVWSVAI
jgi:hypothetical protein